MAITQYYVDPAIAGDSGAGTIGDPFGDLQYALNTVTRDSSNGDQFNIKAGTAEVLASSLTLATYGTPAAGAPLIIRGYTSAANDGGMAEINCSDNALWTSAYNYFTLRDMTLHSFGNNHGISMGFGAAVSDCVVHKGSSSPSSKYLIYGATGNYQRVDGCYIYDNGTNGGCIYHGGDSVAILNCYTVVESGAAIAVGNSDGALISGNVVKVVGASSSGISIGGNHKIRVLNNIVLHASAGTGYGIDLGNWPGRYADLCINNVVVGFSGAGGTGIGASAANVYVYKIGWNAFYNNTTNVNVTGNIFEDDTAHDISLAADPFTDAANGDFSLTTAAQTALRSLGWPASYQGAHANTDPHITVGALQYGPEPAASGGGGGPVVGSRIVRGLGAV